MGNINGTVTGQKLLIGHQLIVSNTNDYLTADFSFSSDWNGLTITAVIYQGETAYQFILDNGRIDRKKHMNLNAGAWTLYLYGVSTDGMRVTTNCCDIEVMTTGAIDGTNPPEIPLELVEQILATAGAAERIAKEAKVEADKTKPYSEAAKASAAESKTSETNAAAYAIDSKKFAAAAKTFEQNAITQATNASSSAAEAKTSEQNAITQATNAKASAKASLDFETSCSRLEKTAAVHASEAKASAQEASTYDENSSASAGLAANSAAEAKTSEQNAITQATNAKASADISDDNAMKSAQALADLLRMLGTDIATLVGGKIPMSQIPATATQEVYEISSEAELTGLVAQRADLAELIELVDGVRTVTKTWQLLGDGDAGKRENWIVWGTSYAVQAGNATTADNAENASTINGHRLVVMTATQYETAVKDPNTYYLVITGGAQ